MPKHELSEFKKGDRAKLDNKVPGTVDGFYGELVVFNPDWKIDRILYGHMTDPSSEEVKLITLSKILVHPSNLKKIATVS